jgi:hypothetical protein
MTRAFSANPNISPTFDFDRGFEDFRGSWRVESMQQDLFDWDAFIHTHLDAGPRRYADALFACLRSDCETIPSLRYGAQMKLRDIGWGAQRDDGSSAAIEYVSDTQLSDDEFLFINLTEAHTPYSPPAPFGPTDVTFEGLSATFSEPESPPEEIRTAYDAAVQYLAHQYKTLFAHLERKYDLIITVSDHGEMLGEHGIWEHLYGVYDELTHVPLVLSGDRAPTSSTPNAVNLIDVHTTILDAFGLTDAPSLLTPSDVPADRSLRTEYHGLSTAHFDRLERQGFDVAYANAPLSGLVTNAGYAHETHHDGVIPASTTDPIVDELAAYTETLTTDAVSDREVSASATQALEDLGYL